MVPLTLAQLVVISDLGDDVSAESGWRLPPHPVSAMGVSANAVPSVSAPKTLAGLHWSAFALDLRVGEVKAAE